MPVPTRILPAFFARLPCSTQSTSPKQLSHWSRINRPHSLSTAALQPPDAPLLCSIARSLRQARCPSSCRLYDLRPYSPRVLARSAHEYKATPLGQLGPPSFPRKHHPLCSVNHGRPYPRPLQTALQGGAQNRSQWRAAQPFQARRHAHPLQGAMFFSGWLAWTVDAWDFFAVSLSVTALEKQFQREPHAITTAITLTLLFRSVGAAILGKSLFLLLPGTCLLSNTAAVVSDYHLHIHFHASTASSPTDTAVNTRSSSTSSSLLRSRWAQASSRPTHSSSPSDHCLGSGWGESGGWRQPRR